jgi:phosphate-selective porin
MSYYAGIDCKCCARSEGDCSCAADWTPTEVYRLRAQLVKAKADGIREAISDYKNKQPLKSANYYVVDALEHMKNYAYKLTNTTIDKVR